MPRLRGFTLIELLVVIAIIAILAAILFPVFARAKAAGKQSSCLVNIKEQVLANLMYASDYDDRLPLITNDLLTDPKEPLSQPTRVEFYAYQATLYPYIRSTSIYSCTAVPGWSYPTNDALAGQKSDGSNLGTNSAGNQVYPAGVVLITDPDENYGSLLAGAVTFVPIGDSREADPMTGFVIGDRMLKQIQSPYRPAISSFSTPVSPNGSNGADFRIVAGCSDAPCDSVTYSVASAQFSVSANGQLSEQAAAPFASGSYSVSSGIANLPYVLANVQAQIIQGQPIDPANFIALNPPHGPTSNFGFLDGHEKPLPPLSDSTQLMLEVGLNPNPGWGGW